MSAHTPKDHLATAHRHLETGDWTPALKLANEVLKIDPAHGDGLRLKVFCLTKLERYPEVLKIAKECEGKFVCEEA